jgi:hypothetical protein
MAHLFGKTLLGILILLSMGFMLAFLIAFILSPAPVYP